MRHRCLLLLLSFSVSLFGCRHYIDISEALNERNASGCIEFTGTGNLSATAIAAGSGAIRIVYSSGGATLEQCRELLR